VQRLRERRRELRIVRQRLHRGHAGVHGRNVPGRMCGRADVVWRELRDADARPCALRRMRHGLCGCTARDRELQRERMWAHLHSRLRGL
jgi:hypothetical protein